MHIHEAVLEAANRVSAIKGGRFRPLDIVNELPDLNWKTVRTHVVSRCCVNAPKNHLHKWPYFRRLARGVYEVMPEFQNRGRVAKTGGAASQSSWDRQRRATIHAVVSRDEQTYVAECLEVAVVTQGKTLDELVKNLNDALALHLEGEDLSVLGLSNTPHVQVLYEAPLAV